MELVSNALSGIGGGTLTVLWEATNRVKLIHPCHRIRNSQWILTCCQLQDTKTLREPVMETQSRIMRSLFQVLYRQKVHSLKLIMMICGYFCTLKQSWHFSYNSNLSSETLRTLIPLYLHHQSEIRALREMGTKRTYMSRGVWLRSGLAPCCCAWGCWEMMRDDLWSLEVTLWRESRGWEIVLQ